MLLSKYIRYHKLGNPVDESLHTTCEKDVYRPERFWRRAFLALLVGFMAVITLLSIALTGLSLNLGPRSQKVESMIQEPYSPAHGHLVYENRWLSMNQRFIGQPRPETDQAWDEILRGTLVRVSGEELASANTTSIPLKGGGYAVGLGISHGLHCLKRIRMAVHKSYYYTNKENWGQGTEEDWNDVESHVDHCIEWLRQLVMCKADLGLYPIRWADASKGYIRASDAQPHVCTNWDSLHAWMISREARVDDLVKPEDQDHDLD